jgi:ferritin-like metal-binding protein YciE
MPCGPGSGVKKAGKNRLPSSHIMKTRTPHDLFFDQLRDLHSVELQLSDSLPGLAARADHAPLYALIAGHAIQTVRQLDLLTRILQRHGIETGTDKCRAMEGLIAGGDAHLDGVDVPETRDLMIVAHASRIEHYEIAGYGIALRLAQRLELQEEALILQSILAEEREAARSLEELEPMLLELAGGGAEL